MLKLNKKIFGTLFFSIFATVTGVGIVVPLLPVYAHDLGASGIYIGMIFGVFSLSRSCFLPYFGRRSDKNGRKPFIVSGLLLYTLISVAFLFSDSVSSLIGIRFFQGIASAMILPVVQAYVGDITPQGSEGIVMGSFNMSLFMGLSFGPLLGGLIKDHFSLQAAFVCMGLLALVGFFLSVSLLPPAREEAVTSRVKDPASWTLLLRDRTVLGLFFFRLAYTTCIGIVWGFLPVLADSEFTISSSAIGMLVMLGVFVSGIVHIPMGWVADRVNKKTMVVIGGLAASVAVVLYGEAHSYRGMLTDSIIFGLGGGVAMPALMAMAVLKGNSSRAMGSVMALMTVAHSVGMMIGSLLAGIMMDMHLLRAAFTVGGGCMLAGLAAFSFFTYSGGSIQAAGGD